MNRLSGSQTWGFNRAKLFRRRSIILSLPVWEKQQKCGRMLSDEQEIVRTGALYLFLTFVPLLGVAVSENWQALEATFTSITKGDAELRRHHMSFKSHATSGLRFYLVAGLIMFSLMAAAITFYWFQADPHRHPEIPKPMYYFTAFAYFLYLACHGICNLIISRNGDVDAAMVIAVFALLLSVWLVVSLAYTVAKYNAGEQPGIIFALVIFSLVFLWNIWYTWFVNGYKNRGRTYHQAKARASRDGAEASVSLLKGY
jgi:hypothetical protein